jgi:predicted component of type VI protein secretion system
VIVETPLVPLDIVALSELVDGAGGGRSSLTRRFNSVDKDNLDALLRDAAPGFSCTGGLPSSRADTRGSSESIHAAPRCVLESFRDFRPERLIEAIPEARELRRLRSALIEVVQGRSGPASVNEALSSIREPAELVETIRRVLAGSPPPGNPSTPAPRPEPPAAAISPSPGASLFDLVDVEGSRERGGGAGSRASGDTLRTHDSVRRGLDGLIEGLLGLSHSPDAPSPATIGRLLSETDRAIADVVRATLFDTGFQSLETAWLSLRFLVRRLDFRTGVRLHVLSVDRTRLLDALREVTLPFLEGLRAEGRLACVLLDFPFGGAAEDVADLTEIAGLAAEARTPIVAAADPAILGIRSLEEIHALPDLSDFFETTGREDWGALRMREETRWLSLCMNRFLLRSPYGKDADQVKGFEFEEILDGMESSAAATQGV